MTEESESVEYSFSVKTNGSLDFGRGDFVSEEEMWKFLCLDSFLEAEVEGFREMGSNEKVFLH